VKGLVLAGGNGTRLRPFSHSMPKQLVPVANKPVLVHCLENLRDSGVSDVCIVVGDRGEHIRAAVDRAALGISVSYVHQPAPLGLAHCVLMARDFLGEDDFVLYLGDNVLVGGIGGLAETFGHRRPAAQLALCKVSNPEEYGVAELGADDTILRLVEKPPAPTSDLAIIGVYFFTAAIHEAIARIRPSRRNELEITDAVQWLVDNGAAVRGERFDGYWKDTGRVEDLLECNQHLLESTVSRVDGSVDEASYLAGPVELGAGARVVHSRILGPVAIGPGTVVEHSYIGPYTTLGAGCVVSHSGIEYSILLDGAGVHGISGVHGSLIGRSAEVSRTGVPGRRHRLILGDHTQVHVPS
jgi:glucose-1-phosphate thymidylyltransferase